MISRIIERTPNILIALVVVILLFSNVGQAIWRSIIGSEEEEKVNSLVSMVQNINSENYKLRLENEAQQAAQQATQYETQLKLRRFVVETYQEPSEILQEMKKPIPDSMSKRLLEILK